MSTPSFLRYNIVTTLRCNLKCKYCLAGCDANLTWESDPIKTVASFKHAVNLIKESTIPSGISIQGGEPLISPSFWKLLSLIDTIDYPSDKVCITTNGLVFNKLPLNKLELLAKRDIPIRISKYPIEFNYNKLESFIKSLGLRFFYIESDVQRLVRITDKTQRFFWEHCFYDRPVKRDKDWTPAKCREDEICIDIYNNKLIPCSNISEWANRTGNKLILNKDYYRFNELDTTDQVLKVLNEYHPACEYCAPAIFHPWFTDTNIKVKQI